MKINKKKLEIIMAKKLMNKQDLIKQKIMTYYTYRKIKVNQELEPLYVGKIAKFLNVEVNELV